MQELFSKELEPQVYEKTLSGLDRNLTLRFSYDKALGWTANGYIGMRSKIMSTINNSIRQHVEHPTTKLYEQAREVLQSFANEHGKTTYTLMSENPKIILWAKDAGNAIFNWDEIVENDIGITCKKIFNKVI